MPFVRSVGSSEAAYGLYGFPLAHRYPSVTVLRVHDKDDQHIVFNEGSEESALETQRKTELTEFFEANKTGKAGMKDLRYVDMPTKFTFNKKTKEWKHRAPNRKCDTLGRVDNIHPAAGDRFYLRMLLNSDACKGKISFDHLKAVEADVDNCQYKDVHKKGVGRVEGCDKCRCASYQEVCQKLGMLQDDHEWEMVLEEASSTRSCKNQVIFHR